MISGLLKKKFTYKRPNTENLQNFFIKSFKDTDNNLNIYLEKINNLKYKKINLYFILPFWIYEEKKNNYIQNKFIFDNFFKLICNIDSLKYKNLDIFVQLNDIDNSIDFLTYDKRHFRSNLINLTTLNEFCNY